MEGRPISRQLPHDRLLLQALAGLLRRIQFRLEFLDVRLRILSRVLRVSLEEQRMIFNLAIEDGLRDRRVIHLGVTVTTEADEVHDGVAAELVAELQRHATGAYYGVSIFAIHMEDRNWKPFRQVRREAPGIRIARVRGEAEQVVDNDVYRTADGVATQIGKIQRLCRDSLPRKSRIAMHQDGQHLGLAVAAYAGLLSPRPA